MKKIIIIGFMFILLTSIFTNQLHAEQTVKTGNEWTYILKYMDVEQEMRRQYIGEIRVPWTDGFLAHQFDSQILTIHDGFRLPEIFFNRWQSTLTRSLVNYWNFTEDSGFDFGWVYYHSSNCSEEDFFIKFKTPLRLWTIGETYVKSTTDASIMKFDTISLFTPEKKEKGNPELEGENLTATLICKNYTFQEDQVSFTYSLTIAGFGTMHFHESQGPLFGKDKNESCTILIKRNGTTRYIKEDSMGIWCCVWDCFREFWNAQGMISGVIVNESCFGRPNERYDIFLSQLPEREPSTVPVFNVRDFGAVGDGRTLDTFSINSAIETCANQQGGIVYFPQGVYLAGSLHLKSNVTLFIEDQAILRGTRDMTKYDPREYNPWDQYQDASQSHIHRSLIWGENLSNIGILGPGIIDGNDAFEPCLLNNRTVPPALAWILMTIVQHINDTIFQRGAKPVALKSCRNVLIKDITITDAADESIFIAGCENIIITGYKAKNVRVDGLDPVCCHNVTITNCEIRSIDDAIAIKSSYILGFKQTCENINVKNTLLATFVNALKIGTESVGDFHNITYRNCIIRNSPIFPSSGGISIISVDGGMIDGVTASDITLYDVNFPIFIRLGDRLRSPEHPSIGTIQNISIQNLTSVEGKKTSTITAVPGAYIGGNITFRNVTVISKGGGRRIVSYRTVSEQRESNDVYPDPGNILPGIQPAYGFFCRHVKGLSFIDVYLEFQHRDLRAALIGDDIDNLFLFGFKAERIPYGAPSVIIR